MNKEGVEFRGKLLSAAKIQFGNLSKTAADLFVKELKSAIKIRTTGAGSGTLEKSIKAVKRSNQMYGVKGAYYFWYANYGRKPGKKPSARIKKIREWAANVGWTAGAMTKYIADFGTKPTLSYETAKKMFKEQKKRIIKNIFENKR